MNISLPDPLKRFVDGQISTGQYSSASEYVRELIRADEKRKAQRELEAKLLVGMRGRATKITDADWAELRRTALAPAFEYEGALETCRSFTASTTVLRNFSITVTLTRSRLAFSAINV
jgi:antitoxin ParD1/3/4